MKKSEAIEEILGPQHLSSPRSNDELEVISELTKYVEKIEGDALDEVVAEQLWWSEKRNRLSLDYEGIESKTLEVESALGLAQSLLQKGMESELAKTVAHRFRSLGTEDEYSSCWPIPDTVTPDGIRQFEVISLPEQNLTMAEVIVSLEQMKQDLLEEGSQTRANLSPIETRVKIIKLAIDMQRLGWSLQGMTSKGKPKGAVVSWSERHLQNKKWIIDQNKKFEEERTYSSANARYGAIRELYRDTFQEKFEKDYPDKDKTNVSEISEGTIRIYLGLL